MKPPKDVILALSVVVVLVASLKFLMDGVTITTMGHTINLGHIDALSYSSFLAPILGVHGYMKVKGQKTTPAVDNPDAN